MEDDWYDWCRAGSGMTAGRQNPSAHTANPLLSRNNIRDRLQRVRGRGISCDESPL